MSEELEVSEVIELGENTLVRFKKLIWEGTYTELLPIHRFLIRHDYKISNYDKRTLINQLILFIMSTKSQNDLNKYDLAREILNALESRYNDANNPLDNINSLTGGLR